MLMPLIKQDKHHQNLYVFDRGMSSVRNFGATCDGKAFFVGRIKTERKMEILRSLMSEDTDKDLGKLELTDDLVVHLYKREKRRMPNTNIG